jgi:hypothetical protein
MNLPLTTATLTFDSCISDLLGRFPAHLFVWLPAFSAHLMFYAGQCCRASCEMKHPAAYHLLPPPPPCAATHCTWRVSATLCATHSKDTQTISSVTAAVTTAVASPSWYPPAVLQANPCCRASWAVSSVPATSDLVRSTSTGVRVAAPKPILIPAAAAVDSSRQQQEQQA